MKADPKLNFAMFVIFVALSIALAIFAYLSGGVDFDAYYGAGRVYLQGGNPYDYSQLSRETLSSTGRLNNPFYYAPWFIWFTLPFSILPYSVARPVWAIFNFVLWFFSLFNLAKLMDYPQNGWRRWGMYLLVTFVFAWTTWGFEQVGILILFMFTLTLLFAARNKWNAVGVLLALLLFKPNITAIPVASILLWLVLRGKWRPVIYAGGTSMLMLIISVIISPNWYLALTQPDKLAGLTHTFNSSGGIEEAIRYNTTLLDFLSAYGISGNAAIIIYGAAIILGVITTAFSLYYSTSILELTAVVLLVNFAVIPYALFYDYPTLVITLFYANSSLLQRPSFAWVRYTGNTLILLGLFIGSNISFRYWTVVILALFMAISIFSRKERPASKDTQLNMPDYFPML